MTVTEIFIRNLPNKSKHTKSGAFEEYTSRSTNLTISGEYESYFVRIVPNNGSFHQIVRIVHLSTNRTLEYESYQCELKTVYESYFLVRMNFFVTNRTTLYESDQCESCLVRMSTKLISANLTSANRTVTIRAVRIVQQHLADF